MKARAADVPIADAAGDKLRSVRIFEERLFMTEKDRRRTGSCLCGGVRYTLLGECRDVINCFCSQCRKTTGHHFAATQVGLDRFELNADSTLSWYSSSEAARRGFCNRCGSSLFWQKSGLDSISVTAGTLDPPTGLETVKNIFVEDASDYHGLPGLRNRI